MIGFLTGSQDHVADVVGKPQPPQACGLLDQPALGLGHAESDELGGILNLRHLLRHREVLEIGEHHAAWDANRNDAVHNLGRLDACVGEDLDGCLLVDVRGRAEEVHGGRLVPASGNDLAGLLCVGLLPHLDPPVSPRGVFADGLSELCHDCAPLGSVSGVAEDVGVLVPEQGARAAVLVPQALGRPDADPVRVPVSAGVGVGLRPEGRALSTADAPADEDADTGRELFRRPDPCHTLMLDVCFTETSRVRGIYPQSAVLFNNCCTTSGQRSGDWRSAQHR